MNADLILGCKPFGSSLQKEACGKLSWENPERCQPIQRPKHFADALVVFREAIETGCPSLFGESDQPCLQHLETSKASFLSRTSSRNGLKAWYVLLLVVPESDCEGFF